MAFVKRALTRRNLVILVVGLLLAGAPLVIFDFWIGGVIERQDEDEAQAVAKRAVGLADGRVGLAVDAIDKLVARGVTTCRADHLIAMREAAFASLPIKEIAIVAPNGQVLCTSHDLQLGPRIPLSIEPMVGADGFSLGLLTLGRGEHMLQVRRRVGLEGNSIAALVPSSYLLPQVANRGGTFTGYAQISTRGGIPIGETGKVIPLEANPIRTYVNSERFGFFVQAELPRPRVAADRRDMIWLALYIVAAVLLIPLAFRLLLPRQHDNDPVAELERAITNGELVPYYQPIVDIRSGQLRGAEVLVRWRKPDGTLVYPGSFIPLAESSGLIRAMTRDLMRRVCVEAGPALGRRPGLKVSFNFAGKLFSDESIVKDVRNIFSNSPIKLTQVVLEVTERDPIENFTETRQIIAALQALGVRIAIDDVGTGHSGLSYMLKLGVDIIKIDKMFVDALVTDRNSTTIVETLVDLAHNMRMDVVAEGVENFEQVVHLRELGVRSAQGYVFAPPLPGSAFLQLVEAIDPQQQEGGATVAKEAA